MTAPTSAARHASSGAVRGSDLLSKDIHWRLRRELESRVELQIANLFWRNADQSLETYYLAYWWTYVFRSGAQGWLEVIPPPGPLLRTLVDARIGGFYAGWSAQLTVEPTWNVSRNLEIDGAYELSRIRFPDRGTGLDAHVARLRIGAAANARRTTTALVQLNSVDDRLGVNLRLRYNFREGSDLWLVYDEGLNTERDAAGTLPRLPVSDTRMVRAS